ncbi:hypothetical protein SAMN04489806_0393 [Paramicrobacterium humi]|uniref:Uncharacterized protein n=1 Tax=Paramicrobacterium humi TaxID=640635 RepID=A0A1H4IZE2_9MICO|nr:hypothetical protein [Microbacterium humi]SEB39434.1 hypothetical protein SAMN04489806_0393 [Microbacterium humi]
MPYVNGKRIAQIIAVVLALAADAMILFGTRYTDVTSDSSGHESTVTRSFLEVNGPMILISLAVPVVVAALPLFFPHRGWQAASVASVVLLAIFVFLGALTIGVFFMPALIAAIVGLAMRRPAVTPRTA